MSFTPATEAARLAEYLRQNPTAIHDSAEDIAEMAGVSLILAKKATTRNTSEQLGGASFVAKPARPAREFRFRSISDYWMGITANPYLFCLITTLVALVLGFFMGRGEEVRTGSDVLQIEGVVASSLFAVTWILQLACFFRHGVLKIVPLCGGIVVGISLLAGFGFELATSNDGPGGIELLLIGVLIFFLLTAVYSLFGAFFAIIGAFVRIKAEQRNKDRLGRQELLELLFDIETRLKTAQSSDRKVTTWRDSPLIRQITEMPFAWSGVLGFGLSLISVLAISNLMTRLNISLDTPQVALLAGVMSLVVLACQIAVSFLAGSVWRAIGTSVLMQLVSIPPTLLPITGFGVQEFARTWDSQIIAGLIAGTMVGLFAGIAATIEQKRTEEKLLLLDDPETLLAEFLDIQKRLNPGPRSMTVMVVDAAKSSIMKSMADPFIAEWSFRAYQQLLERVADEFGGEVLSTAGDGAIITFDQTEMAMRAAWRTHEKIQEFNEKTNKLTMPFKLRIGLHRGMVMGQIDKVQYTDVIDIAAHVEAACQVGGVTVTEPVWESLTDKRGDRLSIAIDSFTVYQLETGVV
jgi:class 3 adenylate cyclase